VNILSSINQSGVIWIKISPKRKVQIQLEGGRGAKNIATEYIKFERKESLGSRRHRKIFK